MKKITMFICHMNVLLPIRGQIFFYYSLLKLVQAIYSADY